MSDKELLSEQIREVLQGALARFLVRPFDDMREGDPQALIFSALRDRVSPAETSPR